MRVTQAPNLRRRRIVGLLLVAGLIAPLPANLLGLRELGLWIFAASGTLVTMALVALPLAKLRPPTHDAKTFRPPIRRLVFDPQNPIGVLAFVFELLLVGVIVFTAFMSVSGFGLRDGEPRTDARLVGPFMGIAAAALLWPIADWFASCVHVTPIELHVRLDQKPRIVPVQDVEALVVRHGRRSPMHAGAVLVLQLKGGGRVLLPGTTKDADAFLDLLQETTGVRLPRTERPIRKRSA